MSDTLRQLADGLERLAHPTDDGRFSWSRLLGRLTRTPRRPRIDTSAMVRMLDRIQYGYVAADHPRHGDRAQRRAVADILRLQSEGIEPAAAVHGAVLRELARNIARAERTSFVHGRLPDGHLDRLWRLYQLAWRATEWLNNHDRRPLLRDLIWPDARCVLAPLVTASSHGNSRPVHGVDALISAANAETKSIGRQRRLLEAARQQLLDAAAALRIEPDAERARRILIARRISRLDRLQAAGVDADVDLGYQVREAAARNEMPRLCAALAALEDNAFIAGDADLQDLASSAAAALWGGDAGRFSGSARAGSLRTSEDQIFGAQLRSSIDRAYAGAAAKLTELRAEVQANPNDDRLIFREGFLDEWKEYLTGQPTDELLAAATAADGCFTVGATSSPVRGANEVLEPDIVRYPQQEMVLEPVSEINDLANAVIGDPRSVLLDLAAGRLLARRYLGYRRLRTGERRLRNEVRVYVLDGSSSMLGPRARMRDAVLLAELSTLSARLQNAERGGNQVLYYRYFNDDVAETHRVASVEDAAFAVDDVLGSLRYGGTNIELALLASFEQIRLAAADDPDLARGQIVLVTDGEAGIDDEKVRRAREDLGTLPVGVSIIALGTQNPELRKLAARQRARGERVFYQFIDDDELRNIVEGDTAGVPIHLPSGAGPGRMTDELRSVLADIDHHLRRIDAGEVGYGADLAAALTEVGLPADKGLDRRTRARIAAIHNDRVSLDAAFLRAFPAVAAPEASTPEADAPAGVAPADSPNLAEVVSSLTTVAEIVENFGTGPLERQADALELLERLLAEAHVSPWDYAELVRRPPEAVKRVLRAVHAAARFGAGS